MRVLISSEQDDIKQVARQFFHRELPFEDLVTSARSADGLRESWVRFSSELGAPALVVPENGGGLGGSFLDLAMVVEESGRALSSLPLFSTTVSTAVLLAADDRQASQWWLQEIAEGRLLVATAFYEDPNPWQLEDIKAVARPVGDGWRLSGSKAFVVGGETADLFLAIARVDGALSLFAVEARLVERVGVAAADQTRSLMDVHFHDVPAVLVGAVGNGADAFATARDIGSVLLSLEAIGGARRLLEVAVEHALAREQFGKPIGSFQVIKHKCADILLRLEAATSAAYHAAWAVDMDLAGLASAARIAKSYSTEAYFFAAAETIQILGGIGFTWEHPAHLYFKRAKSSQLFLGTGSHQREAMATALGL